MKRLIILFLSLICLALCDFYMGMFQKNDKLVAQDRLYKDKIPYRIQYAKYGRIFKCPITYLRVVDRLGYGRGPKTKIIRGGLRKKYVVLRLSAYNSPISVNIYVGCDNKPHKTTKRSTKPSVKKTTKKTKKPTSAKKNKKPTSAKNTKIPTSAIKSTTKAVTTPILVITTTPGTNTSQGTTAAQGTTIASGTATALGTTAASGATIAQGTTIASGNKTTDLVPDPKNNTDNNVTNVSNVST